VELVILIKQNKNKMDKLKKYKTQIFNIITIFLILEFAIYPGLTTANTFANILAGIGLLLLVLWGGLALYNYVRSNDGGLVDKEELKKAEEMLKQREEFQIKAGIKGDFKHKMTEEEINVVAEVIRNSHTPDTTDPLNDIPLSRVSQKTKEKMAKLAKDDIKKQLEASELDFSKIKNINLNKTK
jgi:hypothetical protein